MVVVLLVVVVVVVVVVVAVEFIGGYSVGTSHRSINGPF